MVLLSASRHVILANRGARQLFDKGNVLLHRNGRPVGADPGGEAVLGTLIGQAFGLVSRGANFGPADRYARLAGGTAGDLLMRCERIQPPVDGSGAPPIALLRIFEEERKRRIDREALVAWYGLWRREAELAAAFAEGRPLAAIARENGLSRPTVRTQFSHSKTKRGAADQAAVVGKIIRAAFG